jgi:hypothetical protein
MATGESTNVDMIKKLHSLASFYIQNNPGYYWRMHRGS